MCLHPPVHVYVFLWTCIRKSEVSFSCLSSGTKYLAFFFKGKVSLYNLSSIRWVTSQWNSGSAHLLLPGARVTSMCYCTWLVYIDVYLGFMFMQQALIKRTITQLPFCLQFLSLSLWCTCLHSRPYGPSCILLIIFLDRELLYSFVWPGSFCVNWLALYSSCMFFLLDSKNT